MMKRGYAKYDGRNIRVYYRDDEIPYVLHYCGAITNTAKELGFKRCRAQTMMGEHFVRRYYEKVFLPKVIEKAVKEGPFKTEDKASGALWKAFYSLQEDSSDKIREFFENEAIRYARQLARMKRQDGHYT